MKSGGPWNLRGLRPEAREAADDAALRAGISVGEWLNELIQQSRNGSGALMRQPDSKEEDYGNVGLPNEPTQPDGDAASGSRRPRRRNRECERGHVLAREASLAREEFDDVHSRLHKLTSQLERIARGDAPGRDAPAEPQYSGAESTGRTHFARQPLPASTSAAESAEAPIDLTPRELEKLLSALIEKLDRGRFSRTEHAAFHRLEGRIALLIKRLDASDAQFGNLQSIERGLADLLVHIDRADGEPAIVGVIARDVAEIKCGERRTQDSLEAVHSAVEQLVNRLAMIEGEIRNASNAVAARSEAPGVAPSEKAPKPAAEPDAAVSTAPWSMPVGASPGPAVAEAPAGRADARRPPIDPTLPPDHPLEPGSTIGLRSPSVIARIAALEPASGATKSAAGGELSDRQDFIAAARRAVQAAATPTSRDVRFESRRRRSSRKTSGTREGRRSHARKLLAGACLVLLTVGCLEIALHLFRGQELAIEAPAVAERPLPSPAEPETSSSAVAPSTGSAAMPAPAAPSDMTPGASSNKPEDLGTVPPVAPHGDGPPPPVPAPPPTPSLAPAGITVSPLLAPAPTTRTGSPVPTLVPAPASTPAPASAPTPQPHARRSVDFTGTLPSRVPPPVLALPISASVPSPPPQAETSQASVADSAVENLPVTIGGPTLRAAAIAGDTSAEFEVALRFVQGRGVPADQQQAAHWLELAARQGLAPAQFRLGGFYEKGIGVKKDLAEARRLYLAAAAKGNGKAMHNLAVLYAEGVNGPGDYHTAALWFQKAAERGITDSQYNLGVLYERGSGEPQNDAEAYKWFALAAEQGDREAAAKRDEIASELDQQTLESAELAVKAFKPEPQPDDAINVKVPPGGWDAVERVARAKVPLPVAKPAALESKIK
jgi:localization factor PodJL